MATCAICLDTMQNPLHSIHTSCGHSFHQPCIARWLRSSRTCPLCRSQYAMNLSRHRYRVRSPFDAASWCSPLDRLFTWYITVGRDRVHLSSILSVKAHIPVRNIRVVDVAHNAVTIRYADEPIGSAECALKLHSSEPHDLSAALKRLFGVCDAGQTSILSDVAIGVHALY
jgi:hypothetical protein